MIVNRSGLADVLGVNPTTIDNRLRRGMPYKRKKGNSWEFDTAEVIQWTIEQALQDVTPEPSEDKENNSAKELQRRKLQAETEMAEIELAKKKGLVVLVEDAVSTIADAVANLRAQFLNLPRRAAPLIVGETDVDIVKDTLDREVNELLQELHNDVTRGAEELTEGD